MYEIIRLCIRLTILERTKQEIKNSSANYVSWNIWHGGKP